MAKDLSKDLNEKKDAYIQEPKKAKEEKKDKFVRWTCYFRESDLEKIKDYAYTKRLTNAEAMDEIISEFFDRHKEKLLHDHRRK